MADQYTSLFTDVQRHAADILNSDSILSSWGVSALCESSLDIEFEVKSALAKQGLACIVMVQNATYSGVRSGYEQTFLFDRLVVQLAEQPTVRRAQLKKNGLSSGTSPDVASRVFEVLGAFDENYKQEFCPQTMEEGVMSGLVVTNCAFTCQFSKVPIVHEDYFTVLSTNIGDYDNVILSADPSTVKPEWNEISSWVQQDVQINPVRISLKAYDESLGWQWTLFTKEISILVTHGPSPDTATNVRFDAPQQRVYLDAEWTHT